MLLEEIGESFPLGGIILILLNSELIEKNL